MVEFISRNGGFLWNTCKNNLQSISELKDSIIRVIGGIEPQLCY